MNDCMFYTLDHVCRVRVCLCKLQYKSVLQATYFSSRENHTFTLISSVFLSLRALYLSQSAAVLYTLFLCPVSFLPLFVTIISSLVHSRNQALNKIRPKWRESSKLDIQTNYRFMSHYFQFAVSKGICLSFHI
jgi:hypothetical protein